MTDKLLHFLISFAIALYDSGLALLAGIAKEFADALGLGTPDAGDLLADLLGIFLAMFFR